MSLIPLDIPHGVYKNGTELEAAGRWSDGSLVRWRDGSLRPVGGWEIRQDDSSPTNNVDISTNAPRGMHAWESQNGTVYLAAGSYNELKAVLSSGTIYDIKPTSGFTDGIESGTISNGYGNQSYGRNTYGTARPSSGVRTEVTTWSMDNFGQFLIACSSADGKILEWQLGASSKAAALANAPINNLGTLVTEERFIFALGAGGNPRKVQWCDREASTTWAVATTNEAGDLELATSGQIMQGLRTRGQVLILTDTDAHTARYIGPPYVYSFSRVGTSCGTISRKAAVDTPAGTFWMGPKGFFAFNGNTVSELPCEVYDHVFEDLLVNQQSKVWAWDNSQHGEVWWFYQSEDQGNSGEIDKYVSYSYKDNYWSIGSLSRTAGISRGLFQFPILANGDGLLYNHELNTSGVDGAFAESGPIQIGAGDNVAHVTSVIPDEKSQGGVSLKFKTRFYPNAAETTHGPFTTANPTGVRFSGRQIKMRCDGTDGADFRVGVMRLETVPGGRR